MNEFLQGPNGERALWAVVGLALIFLFFSLVKNDESLIQSSSTGLASEEEIHLKLNQQVTEHLQRVERQAEAQRWEMEQRNRDLAPGLKGQGGLPGDPSYPAHLSNLAPDRSSEDVYRDLNSSQHFQHEHLPDYRISASLEHKRWIAEYDARSAQDYVESFLANAREQGYEVELNENYEVIGVKRIRRPEPLRFPQSRGGETGDSGSSRKTQGGAFR